MFHIMFSFLLLLCSTAYISCSQPLQKHNTIFDDKKNPYSPLDHRKHEITKNINIACIEYFEGSKLDYEASVPANRINNPTKRTEFIQHHRYYSIRQHLRLKEKIGYCENLDVRIGDCNVEILFRTNPDNGEKIRIDSPGDLEKLYAGTHQLKALVSRKNI